MKKLGWKGYGLCALALLLLIASGCQSAGGVDLNQALLNNAAVKSMEGSGQLSLELKVDPASAADPEERQLAGLFSRLGVTLDSVKQQDPRHLSAKGAFTYAKGSIPFALSVADHQMTVQIEGAGQPIVFDNLRNGANEAPAWAEALQKELATQSTDIASLVASYVIGKTGNPPKIDVQSVTGKVHNESLALKQVHVEMSGTDLLNLLKGLLTNISMDDQGLRDLLGQLYDLLAPALLDAAKAGGQDSPATGMLSDKEAAVTMAAAQIHKAVRGALDRLNAPPASREDKADIQTYLDQVSLKLDWYVDGASRIRKQNFDLNIPVPAGEGGQLIEQIRLSGTSENWNWNQPVEADLPDARSGVAAGDLTARKLLSLFDPNSAAYKLLKDDLHITRKRVNLFVEDHADQASATHPYIKNEVTMVPVRFVSEELEAEVKWNQEKQQVTITDAESGTTIVLAIGSPAATVNGREVTLEASPELTADTTFVPVRFIAEALGAKVSWNNDARMVEMIRE